MGRTGQDLPYSMSCTAFGFTGSHMNFIAFGLPYGSILDPLLYISSTADTATVLAFSEVLSLLNPDDSQAYPDCPADNALTVVAMGSSIKYVTLEGGGVREG